MLNRLEKKGWRGLLVYWRGCSEETNRLDVTYHAGRSDDLEAVMRHLESLNIINSVYIAGYSLGANILLKWLGEKGRLNIQPKIAAAFAVSTPFDLGKCADSIDKGFAKIYKHYLLNSLKKKMINKYGTQKLLELLNLTPKDVLMVSSMREFDDRISSRLNGFNGADDYYLHSSCKYYLKDIKVPTVILHAQDDPLMSPDIIPNESELSSYLELRISENGGHVGFVGVTDKKGSSFYLENTILDYFERHQA